ncbi:olfactory receptor 13H1-like isoform X1 [Heteronotia binoei]|uniref:olfactory receptor 13H1-like isoform X1 n=1 Tax=Heteronotia binoei TaxID=13085 RepID=UPI00292CBB93|nr:olfactory receptor 13H1-like isoform X1 [Heteronotia binoei]
MGRLNVTNPVNDNETEPEIFLLTGLSSQPHMRVVLFFVFLILYLITILGNGLIVLLTIADSHLQTPMYFFLGNLSLVDICYTSSTIPQMLAHSFTKRPTITNARCFIQMCISLFLGVAECILLAVMAYDRYVAICSPLHYTLIMNRKMCGWLAAISWVLAFLLTIVPSFAMKIQLCGHNIIDHFMCEVQAVVKLACSDISANVGLMSGSSVFTLLVPFVFILVTYVRIALAVLRIRSEQSWKKALSTCGSHLTVVGIFYSTAMVMYLRPQNRTSEQDKYLAIMYVVVTPMLNPLIYSLRNKDVKQALGRIMGRKKDT